MGKIRADHTGTHEQIYKRNRRRILMQQSVCAICGRPIDSNLKYPDPMSGTADHIIPLNKGGHPSDINNLQAAHWICNRMKSDKLIDLKPIEKGNPKRIRVSKDWSQF